MAFFHISIFSILVISVVNSSKETDDQSENICLTAGYVIAAANILQDMDAQVDPCDDFYRFSCGKFLKESYISEGKTTIDKFSAITDRLTEELKSLVEQPIKTNDVKPFVLIKQLYKVCMDTTAIEENGLTDINEILQSLGGWPVIQGKEWNEDTFDWKESVYRTRKLGFDFSYFIQVGVQADSKNSSRRLVTLNEASLGVPQEVLSKGIENKIVQAYYDYMVEVAVILGASSSNAKEELSNLFNFELELAKISLSIEEWFNVTAIYNPFTINQLNEKYPTMPWVEYINNVLSISGIQVTNEETVIVQVPQYIDKVLQLIQRTSKRVLANYVTWRAIHCSVPYLPIELRNKKFQLDKLLTGSSERGSRGNESIHVISDQMGLAAGALYVRHYFSNKDRENARALVANILSEVENNLNSSDWLDEDTRRYAMSLDLKSFLKSILNIGLFNINNSFKKLRQPVNKTEWDTRMSPIVVNAQYSAEENGIRKCSCCHSSRGFFNADRPEYMNYGGMGFVIGHEISHGFDDYGRHFDKNGNFVDWWTKETNDIFKRKAQCIIDQYSNFRVPELSLNVNGKLILDENIADNGGIKVAYLAYNSWAKRNGVERQLPGLNYTANQMFWVSAANVWCSKNKPELLKLNMLADPHSPDEFRVLGSFSNMEYFAKDFSCPSGTKMDPLNKCHVW